VRFDLVRFDLVRFDLVRRVARDPGFGSLARRMSEYRSNVSLSTAAARLADAQSVAVTTHAKPDGDAFGSVVALGAALRALGRDVVAVFMPPVPHALQGLAGARDVRTWNDGQDAAAAAAAAHAAAADDAAAESDELRRRLEAAEQWVVVDTGAWSQLEPLRPVLESRLDRTLVIDHHISGDVEAALRYIDSDAASCCEIIARFIDELGAAPDQLFNPVVAESLFVGIAADTGWFRFSNTRAETYELAARLKRLGVDHASLYGKLEQAERPEKIALVRRALDSMELLCHGAAALMVLRADDFSDTGAMLEETERIIDLPQIVESVQVAVLATESRRGRGEPIRLSFRSKPSSDAVNVAELAAEFGGGGHARAAGAKVDDSLDAVLRRVREALQRRLSV